jgi:hypothetical protein
MSRDGAIIGVSDHNGWAVLVTVAGDRDAPPRRVDVVDVDLPNMRHHHEGQTLPIEQALDLVERVRVSAEWHAKLASMPSRSRCPRRSADSRGWSVHWYNYLKRRSNSGGNSSSGLSQPTSKYFSQFLAHGRP